MLKYIGGFNKDLSKYGFKFTLDEDVVYIKRTNEYNAVIGLDCVCLSFENTAFDDLIKDGLVIKEND
jgi:hypothetical protein